MAITDNNKPNRPNNGRSREIATSNKPLAAKALRGEDDNLVNPADESGIGAEIYDYGNGGGPDASSSGLKSKSDDTDSNSAASSDLDSGAGVGSAG